MTRPARLSLAFAFIAPAACAQLSTPDPARHGPTLSLRGENILEPRTIALTDNQHHPSAILPVVATTPVEPLGFDLLLTYTNTTDAPKPLARITIGAMALGPEVSYLSVHRGSTLVHAEHDTYITQAWRYPSEAYSPASVVMNDQVAIGASLLYPILEYKHDALVTVAKAGGAFKGPPGREAWCITFDLSEPPYPNQYTALAHPARLAPGETRTYTVAVRAIERTKLPSSPTDAQDWLETLLPYRDYFQRTYGQAAYTRNPRPVLAREVSNGSAITQSNPRGFLGDNATRPDLVGWSPFVQLIRRQTGFSRVMLWAPSGLYNTFREHNYPPHFTLGWKDIPLLRTGTSRLRELPRSGTQLGLWWGRSTQHAESWNPRSLEPLDLTNPEHVRVVHEQLELARAAGCTLIGLDHLTHWVMPAWDQRRFVQALRRVYPEITFVGEPISADFIHALGPAFVSASQAPRQATSDLDFHIVKTPHYLADFLLPGHETWAYFRYSEIAQVRPGHASTAQTQADAAYLARMGFVPVMVTDGPLTDPEAATARPTWETTVPAPLRMGPPMPQPQPMLPRTVRRERAAPRPIESPQPVRADP